VNEELLEIIIKGFTEIPDNDESTGKQEDVNIQKDDLGAKQVYTFF
jgi:hypothetical protein